MKCFGCNQELEWVTAENELTYSLSPFKLAAMVQSVKCKHCGKTYTSHQELEAFEFAVAVWVARNAEKVPRTPTLFRDMRTALGIRALVFAEMLGVDRTILMAWERDSEPIPEQAWVGLFAHVCAKDERAHLKLRVTEPGSKELAPEEDLSKESLRILRYLHEEGDSYGNCVLCRSAPCRGDCAVRKVLERAAKAGL